METRVLVIAHRGASAAAPENTPEAFELADRLGADGVELDVRLWAGSNPVGGTEPRLVVEHDPLPDDRDAVLRRPVLADVLDACGDRLLVNVEIKNGGATRPADPAMTVVDATVDVLRGRGARHLDRWLISSFSPQTVAHVRRIAPEIRTALLVERFDVDAISSAATAGHVAIHPDVSGVTAELVERAHAAGVLVTAWTCNDGDLFADLADRGLDGVCTDVPDVALSRLGRSAARPDPSPRWPPAPMPSPPDRPGPRD